MKKGDEINPIDPEPSTRITSTSSTSTSPSSLKSTSSSSGHLSWNEFLTQGDLLTSSTSSWQWRFYDESNRFVSARARSSSDFPEDLRMGFAFLHLSESRISSSSSSSSFFSLHTPDQLGFEPLFDSDEDEEEEKDEETLRLPLQTDKASRFSKEQEEGGREEQEEEEEEKGEAIAWEFQVLFGVGYQVPVIYFNASRRNGSPLEWPEIIKELVSRQLKKKEEESGIGREQHQSRLHKIITQKEHPILGLSYYHIHPCETATLMKEVLTSQLQSSSSSSPSSSPSSSGNYLLTWLSVVAPLVTLPLQSKTFFPVLSSS